MRASLDFLDLGSVSTEPKGSVAMSDADVSPDAGVSQEVPPKASDYAQGYAARTFRN